MLFFLQGHFYYSQLLLKKLINRGFTETSRNAADMRRSLKSGENCGGSERRVVRTPQKCVAGNWIAGGL